jgi:hypothetical protein
MVDLDADGDLGPHSVTSKDSAVYRGVDDARHDVRSARSEPTAVIHSYCGRPYGPAKPADASFSCLASVSRFSSVLVSTVQPNAARHAAGGPAARLRRRT